MDGEPLRIGALARAAGVGIETVRYYQRRGLLGRPDRPFGGQRLYPPAYVDRLRLIKRAQALGFSLEDAGALLKLDAGLDHRRARSIAAARLVDIQARLAHLEALRTALHHAIHECEHAEGRVACPIIAALLPTSAEGGSTAGPRASSTPRQAAGRRTGRTQRA